MGRIEHAGIYRQAQIEPTEDFVQLDSSNEQWVREVLRRPAPIPEQAEVVWKKSMEEVRDGLMSGPLDKEQLDDIFGQG